MFVPPSAGSHHYSFFSRALSALIITFYLGSDLHTVECIVTVLRISGKLRVYISQSPTDTILHPTLWVSETPQGSQVKTTVHPRGNGKGANRSCRPFSFTSLGDNRNEHSGTGRSALTPQGPELQEGRGGVMPPGHVVKGLRLWSAAAWRLYNPGVLPSQEIPVENAAQATQASRISGSLPKG